MMQTQNNGGNLPVADAVTTNPFDQVNKFDLAQWNRIVEDIENSEVAEAVILVMDQRDALKSLFPAVYVRAHQTRLKFERKKQLQCRRMAFIKQIVMSVSRSMQAFFVSINGKLKTLSTGQ